jgi:AcrR family transcriptional regulator
MVKTSKDATTEQRILEAAKKVFVSKGMAGARMQDIADEAGINKALLHYYFRNKEQLFETIFLEVSTQFWPQVSLIFESDKQLFEKIEEFCNAYITKVLENPYIPMFVLNEMNQNPEFFFRKIWKSGPPKLGKFVQQIDDDIKANKIKPVSPVQLLMNMISMCVFPFIGKPIFQAAIGLDDLQYRLLLEQRKQDVPRFIIESIRK